MRATVALIGKNEQNTIPRLISSLGVFREMGGEILLVDTGSTDSTIKVAKSLGITVYETGDKFYKTVSKVREKQINRTFIVSGEKHMPMSDSKFFDFAAARNYAVSLAKTDFVLTPDCDEIFAELDLDILEKVIGEGYEKIWSTFICSWDASGNPVLKLSHCRMYDRRKFSWKGMIHESLEGSGKEITLPIILHHRPEIRSRQEYLGALALCAYNDRRNDRISHYFARELMYRGRAKSAIREFRKHIDLKGWSVERSQSAVYLGDCLLSLEREDEAVHAWQLAWDIDATRRMPLIRLAGFYDKKGDFRRAATYALAATAVPYQQFYIDDESHYRELPYEIAFRNFWYIGSTCKVESKRCFDKAMEIAPWKHEIIKNWFFYYPTPLVSIVIPHLGRPEKLVRLKKSIEQHAGYGNLEVIIEEDSFENRQGAPKTFKRGVEKARGELIMFLGNDCIGQSDFVLQAVIKMHQTFGPAMDGLVCLNDQVACDGGKKATHWLASKKLLPMLDGEFFNTAYEHCFCDNELTDRCKQLDKYVFAPLAIITHDNVLNNGGELDEVLKIAYDADRYKRDEQTYYRRKAEYSAHGPVGPIEPVTITIRRPYPQVGSSIDLRNKFAGLDIENLRVLNIGLGTMLSGIARQLFYWRFKRLDHVDTHLPYIEAAKRQQWDAQEVRYFNKGLQQVDNFEDYDLILIFDVLEHLEKHESMTVLDLINKSGAKLLVFGPLEKEFRENTFGAESQDHLSLWTENDFKDKGYATELLVGFHRDEKNIWDAVWAQNWGK